MNGKTIIEDEDLTDGSHIGSTDEKHESDAVANTEHQSRHTPVENTMDLDLSGLARQEKQEAEQKKGEPPLVEIEGRTESIVNDNSKVTGQGASESSKQETEGDEAPFATQTPKPHSRNPDQSKSELEVVGGSKGRISLSLMRFLILGFTSRTNILLFNRHNQR
jgi:hypothetical protein